MSFDRLSSLESQPTTSTSTGYSDDPHFSRTSQSLSARLFTLTSNTTQLNRQLALIGTTKDTELVRTRVSRLLTETRDGFRHVSEDLKKLGSDYPDHEVSPAMKYTIEKLGTQLGNALADFQAAQRLAAEKTRQYVKAARAAQQTGDPSAAGDVPLAEREMRGGVSEGDRLVLLQEERLADQSEVDFQEELILQREEDMRNIERGVTELNDIFNDLGMLVRGQGDQLDMISDNVGRAADHQRAAASELNQAARYQKGARNRMCCLLMILAIILTVVLLAIFVG
ncbi:t-SNARE [Ascodesmis nigricans]|uniref:t-SNARE n=1 Tax=Ascodesmis nigricans TaxID=341454 RepID=A0A4S2N5G2_9PEZI|nr:t-SNARE [Ascodesmis nigricans]